MGWVANRFFLVLIVCSTVALKYQGPFSNNELESLPPLSPEYPFENIPNPDIPTLQQITSGALTDADALASIADYYNMHEDWLQEVLEEQNPTRLQALYVMHIIHISHLYGETVVPTSLIDYVQQRYSHCGGYSFFQAQILDAFGITWRIFSHYGAEHVWIEVNVDGNWEVFDATVNVWIDRDGYQLIDGRTRTYRALYSPLNDIDRPDAREHYFVGPSINHRVGWYNMPRLRQWMPGLGLYYTPPSSSGDFEISASSPGQGSLWNTPWLGPLDPVA